MQIIHERKKLFSDFIFFSFYLFFPLFSLLHHNGDPSHTATMAPWLVVLDQYPKLNLQCWALPPTAKHLDYWYLSTKPKNHKMLFSSHPQHRIQNAKPTPFMTMVGSKNSKPPTIKNQYVNLPQTIAETKSKLTLTPHFTDSYSRSKCHLSPN